MTEQEAIKLHIAENIHRIEVIEDFLSTNSDANDKECRKNINILTKINKALEEIQQYRAIGTVDKFRQLSEQFKPHITDNTSCPKRNCNKCDMYRKENEKYHAIGTIEECRAAVEKQRAKKSDIEGDWDSDGHLIYDTWICPNCGRDYEINYDYYNYCPNCGQHIDTDWSEEE